MKMLHRKMVISDSDTIVKISMFVCPSVVKIPAWSRFFQLDLDSDTSHWQEAFEQTKKSLESFIWADFEIVDVASERVRVRWDNKTQWLFVPSLSAASFDLLLNKWQYTSTID